MSFRRAFRLQSTVANFQAKESEAFFLLLPSDFTQAPEKRSKTSLLLLFRTPIKGKDRNSSSSLVFCKQPRKVPKLPLPHSCLHSKRIETCSLISLQEMQEATTQLQHISSPKQDRLLQKQQLQTAAFSATASQLLLQTAAAAPNGP